MNSLVVTALSFSIRPKFFIRGTTFNNSLNSRSIRQKTSKLDFSSARQYCLRCLARCGFFIPSHHFRSLLRSSTLKIYSRIANDPCPICMAECAIRTRVGCIAASSILSKYHNLGRKKSNVGMRQDFFRQPNPGNCQRSSWCPNTP